MIDANETRDRIVSAAREVIVCKGKRGATTREIADRAGVNEVTLFRHFGNKESLIRAVVEASRPRAQMRQTVAELHGPIEQDLHRIGVPMVGYLESMIDLVRSSLAEAAYENGTLRDVIIDYFCAQVEAGTISGNPDDLASVFIGVIFSRTIARDIFRDARLFNDTEYAIRFFVDVFLNGVRSK